VELAAFVVQAVVVEKRSVREVARAHGVSKTWLYELLARYRAGGEAALVPRSRRPRHSPTRVPDGLEDEIVALRKQLSQFGTDAGPDTIHTHLTRNHGGVAPCSVSSVWRILTRRGFITPEPRKRPKSSYVRFEAALPNERWQMDMTHVALRNGRVVEVLNVIDDHSRLCVASHAFRVVTAADVVATFYDAATRHGFPASVLSDNGAIFTASSRGDRGALSTELAQRGIVFKHSRPYHPQTCGKVERFHQTVKKHLDANPAPRSLAHLQAQLDVFATYYNEERPHRAKRRMTPRAAFNARVKATPSGIPVRDPASSASATTASTRPAKSRCATPANSATSASDAPTKDATSSSSSTTATSESSPATANTSPNYESIPTGPTSPTTNVSGMS
jgi:transposase InsO family protein